MSSSISKCSILSITILLIAAVMLSTPLTAQSAGLAQAAVNLPKLTGPYNVGRVQYEWVDQSREETYASVSGLKRDLVVYIWFPASITKRTKLAPYMDPLLMDFIAGQAELVDKVHSHAYSSHILDTDKPNYPVLIFAPSTESTSLMYASIAEEIASHGYIVIGTSHPYAGFIHYPDDRLLVMPRTGLSRKIDTAMLKVWTQDIQFVLDQAEKLNTIDDTFKGHLDLTHIGVFGHYFGGAAAANAASVDSRIKAGADLYGPTLVPNGLPQDPSYETGIMSQPFLFMGVGAAPTKAQSTKGKYWLDINGAGPANYGDRALLLPLIPENSLMDCCSSPGSMDATRALQIINSNLLAFFDHNLKDAPLNWPAYSEVRLTTFE